MIHEFEAKNTFNGFICSIGLSLTYVFLYRCLSVFIDNSSGFQVSGHRWP